MQSGGLEHGLRPVRAAGLQPAAASSSHAHFPKSGVQLRWARRLPVCVPKKERANAAKRPPPLNPTFH